MPPIDTAEMLAAYDAHLRAYIPDPLPAGERVELDGPLVRFLAPRGQGWVLYSGLGGIDGAALDGLIARQVAIFRERGQRFEWKYHGHDRPADLPDRLMAAGLRPEERETVVIGRVDDVAAPVVLPDGVRLREVTGRADLDRIDALEAAVWSEDRSGLGEMLEAEIAADPEAIRVVVAEAEADGRVVCAAWARFPTGTEFATFWGGATLEAWRGRGIYRATVAHRANLAAERGLRYIEVDASDDSNPILQRLGFVPVTTTTPYVWKPPEEAEGGAS
jgi:GNAT superfamily N-acetyltransferase